MIEIYVYISTNNHENFNRYSNHITWNYPTNKKTIFGKWISGKQW